MGKFRGLAFLGEGVTPALRREKCCHPTPTAIFRARSLTGTPQRMLNKDRSKYLAGNEKPGLSSVRMDEKKKKEKNFQALLEVAFNNS